MKGVKLSYYIAKKINSVKLYGQSVVSVRIATISIAVSIIVMVISSAVVNGFREDITERLFNFAADFQVVDISNGSYTNDKYISTKNNYIHSLNDNKYIDGVSGFVFKTALLKSQKGMKGVGLKGVGSDFDWTRLDKYLVEGKVLHTASDAREKKVFVSQKTADQLNVSVGDRVEVVYLSQPPRRDLFTVGGVYRSNIPDIDERLVLCDIRDLQRINGWQDDMITGYDLYLKDSEYYIDAESDIEEVVHGSSSSFYRKETIVDTRSKYDSLLGWLELLGINELVIMIIMIIVSVFNVVSMVLIILLQKISMIGILKSIGMRDFYINLIFVFRAMKELIRGVVIGNVVAIILCVLQKRYELITLDNASYLVSSVPISLEVEMIIFINVILLTALFISQLLATMIVTKMQPYKAIKYEKR